MKGLAWKAAVGLLVALAVGWGALQVAELLGRPTAEEFAAEQNARARAEARADTATQTVWTVAEQYAGEAELRRTVEARNEELAAELERQEATLLTTQRTVAELRERLTGPAEVTTDTVTGERTVHVAERNEYPEGGEVGVEGQVYVPGDTTQPAGVDLEVWARLALMQTCARTPDGAIRCDAETNVPGFRVDSVRTQWNLDDPVDEIVRPEGGLWGLDLLGDLPTWTRHGLCALAGGLGGVLTGRGDVGVGTFAGCELGGAAGG